MSNVIYTDSFKKSAVLKLVKPSSMTLSAVSKELGLPASTLFGWKSKYAKISTMNDSKKNNKLSAEEKLEIISKTYSMNELELGTYLRTKGLHSTDIELFKNDFLSSIKGKGRPKLDPEVVSLRKGNKQLSQDLKKTQKALAEQSARIILLKKSHEIWGIEEDDA